MRRDPARALKSRDWKHILRRAAIHMGAAPAVYLLFAFGLHSLGRALPAWSLPPGAWALALPALLAFTAISLREVADVARGGWWAKSVIDWIGWALGLGGSAWLVRSIALAAGGPPC